MDNESSVMFNDNELDTLPATPQLNRLLPAHLNDETKIDIFSESDEQTFASEINSSNNSVIINPEVPSINKSLQEKLKLTDQIIEFQSGSSQDSITQKENSHFNYSENISLQLNESSIRRSDKIFAKKRKELSLDFSSTSNDSTLVNHRFATPKLEKKFKYKKTRNSINFSDESFNDSTKIIEELNSGKKSDNQKTIVNNSTSEQDISHVIINKSLKFDQNEKIYSGENDSKAHRYAFVHSSSRLSQPNKSNSIKNCTYQNSELCFQSKSTQKTSEEKENSQSLENLNLSGEIYSPIDKNYKQMGKYPFNTKKKNISIDFDSTLKDSTIDQQFVTDNVVNKFNCKKNVEVYLSNDVSNDSTKNKKLNLQRKTTNQEIFISNIEKKQNDVDQTINESLKIIESIEDKTSKDTSNFYKLTNSDLTENLNKSCYSNQNSELPLSIIETVKSNNTQLNASEDKSDELDENTNLDNKWIASYKRKNPTIDLSNTSNETSSIDYRFTLQSYEVSKKFKPSRKLSINLQNSSVSDGITDANKTSNLYQKFESEDVTTTNFEEKLTDVNEAVDISIDELNCNDQNPNSPFQNNRPKSDEKTLKLSEDLHVNRNSESKSECNISSKINTSCRNFDNASSSDHLCITQESDISKKIEPNSKCLINFAEEAADGINKNNVEDELNLLQNLENEKSIATKLVEKQADVNVVIGHNSNEKLEINTNNSVRNELNVSPTLKLSFQNNTLRHKSPQNTLLEAAEIELRLRKNNSMELNGNMQLGDKFEDDSIIDINILSNSLRDSIVKSPSDSEEKSNGSSINITSTSEINGCNVEELDKEDSLLPELVNEENSIKDSKFKQKSDALMDKENVKALFMENSLKTILLNKNYSETSQITKTPKKKNVSFNLKNQSSIEINENKETRYCSVEDSVNQEEQKVTNDSNTKVMESNNSTAISTPEISFMPNEFLCAEKNSPKKYASTPLIRKSKINSKQFQNKSNTSVLESINENTEQIDFLKPKDKQRKSVRFSENNQNDILPCSKSIVTNKLDFSMESCGVSVLPNISDPCNVQTEKNSGVDTLKTSKNIQVHQSSLLGISSTITSGEIVDFPKVTSDSSLPNATTFIASCDSTIKSSICDNINITGKNNSFSLSNSKEMTIYPNTTNDTNKLENSVISSITNISLNEMNENKTMSRNTVDDNFADNNTSSEDENEASKFSSGDNLQFLNRRRSEKRRTCKMDKDLWKKVEELPSCLRNIIGTHDSITESTLNLRDDSVTNDESMMIKRGNRNQKETLIRKIPVVRFPKWVSCDLKNFINTKLSCQANFKIELKCANEKFLRRFTQLVECTIKLDEPSLYRPLIKELKDMMFSLKIFQTNIEFSLFFERFTPLQFQRKAMEVYFNKSSFELPLKRAFKPYKLED